MKETIQRLKNKWQIASNRDFVLIMLVFSLAGLGVSFSRHFIFALLGLETSSFGVKLIVSLLLIVPLYQLSTLVFAFPLGQFGFFWARQKEMARFIGRSINRAFRADGSQKI
jgi:hypothetical protein